MKKLAAVLLAAICLFGAVQSALALEIIVGKIILDKLNATEAPPPPPAPTPAPVLGSLDLDIQLPKLPTPKPTLDFDIDIKIPLPTVKIPNPPAAEPTPKPAPAETPKPTKKPAPKAPSGNLSGAETTSFGLYFEDFRPKLTDEWYMFTPVDLGVEGQMVYPLVAQNAWIVGAVTITVAGGNLTVAYRVEPGVAVTREFFTVAGTLDDLKTLNPGLLAGVQLPFNQPINIAQRFGGDRLVVLYLNNSVDFKTNLPGVTAFVPDQHKLFMQNMISLVD